MYNIQFLLLPVIFITGSILIYEIKKGDKHE